MSSRPLALAAILAVAPLAACTGVNESASVAISAVCAITDDCTFAATCDAQYIGDYVFDRSLASQFWVPVQVNNRVLNNADPTSGRVNTYDAHITSFEIAYDNFGLTGASKAVNYTVPANGTAAVGLYVVPPQAAAVPGTGTQASVARIVAKGYFEDGSTFETGEFPLAFTSCSGCLASTFTCTAPATVVVACGSYGVLPTKASCVAPPTTP